MTGIDDNVDRCEIEDGTTKNLDDPNEGNVGVVSIRPKRYGNQNATVVAKAKMAKELIRKGESK